MPSLLVVEGPDAGRGFPLSAEPVSIGRERGAGICLGDSEASRRHAEACLEAGGVRLRDTGSANGTLVNQLPIRDALLKPGDRIRIGRTVLQVQGDAAPEEDFVTQIVKRISGAEADRFFRQPAPAEGAALKVQLAHLGAMYESSRAISRITDIDELLDHLMGLVFGCIAADQGCIMLCGEGGQIEAKAVRRRRGGAAPEVIFSRTIMDYVLRLNQGILLKDAGHDARFEAGESVSRFALREVICAPMAGRHATLGVLFLDTQSSGAEGPAGAFTEEHLSLAIALGHQAALAVEDTRYRQAMLQNERLAGIGQTIAAISHHVKNIMQGVVFGSDMVRAGLADDDRGMLGQGWRLVEKNQKKIHDLVMDMLSYSKPREPELEPCDLNALCAEVAEHFAGRARDLGAGLKFEPNRELPHVPVDPDGIHKALLNVVGNALDAVEDRPHPRVEISLWKEGEGIAIRVEDNGEGIPADRLSDIFKPFISTKGSRGTGLGLPVSQKIMQEHGGELAVESEVGKGSIFCLRLPQPPSTVSPSHQR